MRPAPTSPDVRYICTGTIVSPHVVLTAAHCVDPSVTGPGQLGIFAGNDLDDAEQVADASRLFTAKKSAFDPDFDSKSLYGGHDIGVIVTSKALPSTPVPIRRAPIGSDDIGAAIRVVGAGKTVASDDSSTGRLFEFSSSIGGIDDWRLIVGDETLCGGDSGGPSFLVENGRDVLVGVHSFGEHATTCTGRSYDERVDVHADFVDLQIKSADPDFEPENVTLPDDGGTGVTEVATPDASPAASSEPAKSGCAMRPPHEATGSMPLGLLALGLVVARRRARSLPTSRRFKTASIAIPAERSASACKNPETPAPTTSARRIPIRCHTRPTVATDSK
jgi:hypothetical protein